MPAPTPTPAPSPIGQTAHYSLVTGPRTSPSIQSGSLTLTVTGDSQTADSYDVKLDYDITAEFVGRQTGSQVAPVPKAFFTPQFMADLRAKGSFQSEGFLATYQGQHDVTAAGVLYPQCDQVLITGVDQPQRLVAALEKSSGHISSRQKLQMTISFSSGIPVLGAAAVDIKANIGRSVINVGGDYTP